MNGDGNGPPSSALLPESAGPREILRGSIGTIDPSLEWRARLYLRERGYLLPLRALALRALARSAYGPRCGAAERDHAAWTEERIGRAAEELLEEQAEEERAELPLERTRERVFYEGIARRLGVELESARLICVVINALSSLQRRALILLEIERTPIARAAGELDEPMETVESLRGDARRALEQTLRRQARLRGRVPPRSRGR